MKIPLHRVGCAALLVLALSGVGNAGFIDGFAGNTYVYEPISNGFFGSATNDGHISFAVYKNETSSTAYLFDNAVTLETGEYAYFYQVVNSHLTGKDKPLDALAINLGEWGTATRTGVVANWVFTDGTDVSDRVGASNYGFGVDATETTNPEFENVVSEQDSFENLGNGSSAVGAAGKIGSAFGTNYVWFNFDDSGIATSGFTSLLYFTSTQGPTLGGNAAVGWPPTVGGSVPVPAPVPGTLVLLLGGIPFLGVLRWKMA